MKKYFFVIALLASALVASAGTYDFDDLTKTVITAYEGTEKPLLPNPKKRIEREQKYSYAPGRMHLPVRVVVNKRKTTVNVMTVFGDTLDTYRVCASRNMGQKKTADDCRTPEGNFGIIGLYESSTWRYKGTGSFCYGPYFVSVLTPGFYGIGMHGTNAPGSIPGRHSHGCMRLLNENAIRLKGWLNKDSRIIVLSDNPAQEAMQIAKVHRTYVPGRKGKATVSAEAIAKYEKEQAAARAADQKARQEKKKAQAAAVKAKSDAARSGEVALPAEKAKPADTKSKTEPKPEPRKPEHQKSEPVKPEAKKPTVKHPA